MKFSTTIMAALCATCFATTAHAQKGIGTIENLEFVADTRYPGLSLCHHVEHIAVKGIPITSESIGYALATDQCKTPFFETMSTEEFLVAQRNGYIASGIPSVPSLSKAQFALNIIVIGGLLVFGIGGFLWKIGLLRRPARALNNSGLIGTGLTGAKDTRIPLSQRAQVRMLAAMCFVAQADGSIEGDEVIGIGKMIAKFTGEKVTFESVVKMIHYSADYGNESDMDTLGNGLKPRECAKILDAAIAVARSDHTIHPTEVAVINRIAKGLGLPAPVLVAEQNPATKPMQMHPAE